MKGQDILNRRTFISRVVVGGVAMLLLTGSSTTQLIKVPEVPVNKVDQLNSMTLNQFKNYIEQREERLIGTNHIIFEFIEDTFGVYNVGFLIYLDKVICTLSQNPIEYLHNREDLITFNFPEWLHNLLYEHPNNRVTNIIVDDYAMWNNSIVRKEDYLLHLDTI